MMVLSLLYFRFQTNRAVGHELTLVAKVELARVKGLAFNTASSETAGLCAKLSITEKRGARGMLRQL